MWTVHIFKMKMRIVRIFKMKMWTVHIFKMKTLIVRILNVELEYRTLSRNRRPGAVPHFQNENADRPHFRNENVDCPHFQNEMWAVRVLKCGIGERPHFQN